MAITATTGMGSTIETALAPSSTRTGWSIPGPSSKGLRLLATQATTRGDEPAFTAALKDFDRLLRLYLQVGERLTDLRGRSRPRAGR